MASPNEIAQALSDPQKRKLWEINLQKCVSDGK
jgi:hypothetical protein